MILPGAAMARYCGDGHLLYTTGGALYSIAFDPVALKTSGEAVQVVSAIARDPGNGAAHFSCARDGTLAYVPAVSDKTQLFWASETALTEAPKLPPGRYMEVQVSPDGNSALMLNGNRSWIGDVWVLELSTGDYRRLTVTNTNTAPIWSANSRTVYYMSFDPATNVSTLMKKPADGSGNASAVGTVASKAWLGWVSADETAAIIDRVDPANSTYDIVRLTFGSSPSLEMLAKTPKNEVFPTVSPNQRWLAYQSDATGRPEIWVLELGGKGEPRPVTTEGGDDPRWARDGKQLFYRSSNRLMAVPVEDPDSFRYGKARPLFDGIYNSGNDFGRSYDFDPKSRRFLVVRLADAGPTPRAVRVVLNWPLGVK